MAKTRILVVDDEPDIRELIGEILAEEGFEPVLAASGAAAREAAASGEPDLILLDVWMPDVDGISLLREWREAGRPDCPVVMISGHGSVEAAVEATRMGAMDFIEKPVSLARLLATIENALERFGAGREKAPRPAPVATVEPVGRSLAVQRLREAMERVAGHDAPVLITGESGTGKQQVARWIHARSRRARAPFVTVACRQEAGEFKAALGAAPGQGGMLDSAAGGVVYLDDVSRLDRTSQESLLIILDRSGSGNSPDAGEAAVRFIAATSASLERSVRAGLFLEALYYRLNVLPVAVPSLRERAEDIPDLVRYYAEHFPARDGVAYRHFPVAVQNRLRQHDWPGNLTELANLIRRLLVLGGDDEVGLAEVEAALGESRLEIQPVDEQTPPLFELPLREAREAFERQYLIFRLKTVGGSVGQLAEAVEMERTHLYRKLRQLGIDPKEVVRGGGG